MKIIQDRYAELCAQRDAINAANAPLEVELEKANAAAARAQLAATAIAAQIDDNRGRAAWLDLKREIAALARALSRPV